MRDLADEPRAVGRAERRAGLGQRLVDGLGDLLVEVLLADVALGERLAQLVDGLGLGGLPDLGERVVLLRAGIRRGGGRLGPPHAPGERAPAPVGHHWRLPTAPWSDCAISWSERATRDLGLSTTTGWPRLTETGMALSDGSV